jgi:glucokinase
MVDIEPAEVAARALAGSDPRGDAAVRLWLDLIARFSRDMALTFLATGGVYLAGGILPRLARLIDGPAFRAAFEDHPTIGAA